MTARCKNRSLWSEWNEIHIHEIPEYGRTGKGLEEAIKEWIDSPMEFGVDLEVHIIFHVELEE